MKEIIKNAISTAGEVVENDKTLIIFALLIYGVIAMMLRIEGSIDLIEKLSSGLLGMAIGRTLK